jgi:hypothetical protein
MHRSRLTFIPPAIVLFSAAGLMAYGPIAQLAHYHDFADQSAVWGIPHAADVLSNLVFGIVALWGAYHLGKWRDRFIWQAGWPGYCLFLIALLLTAIGSSYYHLAPDNARLVWDRLPIALACAGLLAAVRAECVPDARAKRDTFLLGLFAVASVLWWQQTDHHGIGDLRPYLLLQVLPLVLIPLWQIIYKAPTADRVAFAAALLLYIAAKATELLDYPILHLTGMITGHTLKHLLAGIAAGVIVMRLVARTKQTARGVTPHRIDRQSAIGNG